MIGGSPIGGYPVGGYEQPEAPASGSYTLTCLSGSYSYTGQSAIITIGLQSSQQGAGRSRRRRRYIVEIDGQEFDVASVSEAEELLEKAKDFAEKIVETAKNSTIIKPGLKIPQIRTPNRELVPAVQAVRSEIRDLFEEARRDLEIRMLLARAEEEDEEETIIRLLM